MLIRGNSLFFTISFFKIVKVMFFYLVGGPGVGRRMTNSKHIPAKNTFHLTPVQGCTFCELKQLHALNKIIFDRLETDDWISRRAETMYKVHVSSSEVRKHRLHLTRNELDLVLLDREAELLRIPPQTHEKIIISQTNALRLELARLQRLGLTSSPQYINMLGKLKEFIELQSRLKGEMVEKSEMKITFAELAKRLKKPTPTHA